MPSPQLEVRQSPSQGQFVRDQLIWVYYSLIGLNCYVMSALGPVMPFLRGELALNYQLAGMHFSSFALGTVMAGLSGDLLLGRLGRVGTLWLGVGGTIFGVLCFVAGQQAAVTISGILISGFCTSLTYQTLANVISDHLSELRTFAFVEAEVAAMLGAMIAPFAVSGFVSARLGWRASLLALILMFSALAPSLKKFGTTRQTAVPDSQAQGKLPLLFWSYALVIFLSVCAEWSTAFWSADYLHVTLLVSKATAAAAVGAFFAGMVAGRLGGTRLVRIYAVSNLLMLSGTTSIIGFLMFWLGHLFLVNVIGLFLTGLGIANMYPLSFAAAVAAASGQSAKAIARVSLMCGTALLTAPLLLSIVADKSGLFTAYSMVAAVLVLCAVSILWANRLSGKTQASF
jgi:fucose permease